MTVSLKTLFGLVGGLGLFIYGMQLMADGLQKTAGDRLRRLLEILTKTPLIGVIVGTVVTMIIQSSSATTVMVVGFVNAGLLNLRQAISVIMGAAIGTTITAFMVSLKLTELALPAIGIGLLVNMTGRRKSTRFIGQTVLGFGVLFLGMEIMGTSLQPLKNDPVFTSIILNLSKQPLLGVLAGAIFTAIIQSSSATTGLVVTLAAQGLIDLNASVALVLGSNIGTTVTAMLASIGTGLNAKRTAVAHLLFKMIGVTAFLVLFRPFTALVSTTHYDLSRQVANAHIIFNVTTTLCMLPFISYFARLVENLLPGQDSTEHVGALYLDEHLLSTPSIALGQANRELRRMGRLALGMLDDVYACFRHVNLDRMAASVQKETAINNLEHEIVSYLVKLSRRSLSNEQSARLNALINISSDFERMGDLAENIGELAEYRVEHRLPFSQEAIAELDDMYGRVSQLINDSLTILESGDIDQLDHILAVENSIDLLEKSLRRHHINRLNTGVCFPASGVIYLDMISTLERIADHANNTAEALAGIGSTWIDED
ncbi:MAG: Na/Pi cotransporter family protein [Bacillota bacterium]